jgi:hypothetical protein
MQLEPVPGHPGYFASSDGRIKGPKRWLTPFPDRRGYLRFNTFQDGKWTQLGVHAAVCLAFHGPRPAGYHAAHLNGDCRDNRSDNLKWCTPAENESHKKAHGTDHAGERHPMVKLTSVQVGEIRNALRAGTPGRTLASQYSVTESCISAIKHRKVWRDIP